MESFTDMVSPDHFFSTPPDYSSRPLPGEKCIQKTPRETRFYNERCAFTYEEQNMTLVLLGCREEDGIPTFGLCSTVRGELALTHARKIISVIGELQAQILVKGRSGSSTHTLFSKQCLLWRRTDSGDPCPSLLPLSISFPSTYRDINHNHSRRLPPSMSIREPHRLDIVHSLKIVVRKNKCPIFPWKIKEICMSAYLRYSPKVRPPRPSPIGFSDIKSCPEEWQEEIWKMGEALSDEVWEIRNAQCHIFIPSVRVFSSSVPIPFHISLSTSSAFLDTVARHAVQTDGRSGNPFHVFLLRRTTLRKEGSTNIHEEVLGIGRMSHNVIVMHPLTEDSVAISWDGEVCCERPVSYASFTIGMVEVRDLLVFSLLAAPSPLKCILPERYRAIPIRLVKHPWIDRS